MAEVQRIGVPPRNMGAFVDEAAAGLRQIYGETVASAYLKSAPSLLSATICHPSVRATITGKDGTATGLLLSVRRKDLAEIAFLHVLAPQRGQGLERSLVEESVSAAQASGITGIVCDHVPLCPLEVDTTFMDLGFHAFPRLLMKRPLPGFPAAGDAPPVEACPQDAWFDAAACLVDAYRYHPGAALHAEVQEADGALDFLQRVAAGNYGLAGPEFCRTVWVGGRCAGVIVGCTMLDGIGFVLQVAVRRAYRGRGLGRLLLCSLAEHFDHAGSTTMALGVTASNPARRLYERLGFSAVREMTAYAWWREAC